MIAILKKGIQKYQGMNNKLKATAWFLACSFVQRGITVITTPIFTRLMTTAEFGDFSVFSSWLEIFSILFTFKMSTGCYMRGLVKYEEDRENFTSSLLMLSLLILGAWLLVYLPLANQIQLWIGLPRKQMLMIFVLALYSVCFGFWSARKRLDYNYRPLVFATVAISVLKPLLGICFVLLSSDNKVDARIWGSVAAEILVYSGIVYTLIPKRKPVLYHKEYWKYALAFNIPLVPHYLSQIILNHSDRIMIKAFCGAADAGVYSLAYSIAMLMILFNTSIHNTMSPWNYQQIKAGNFAKMRKVWDISCLGIAGLNILLILVAPEAIALFAPAAYHEATGCIPPVSMSVFFMYLYGLFVNVEMYYQKTKTVMVVSLIGAVLNLVLNAIFIPMFGYTAAAYTTLACFIVYCGMHGIYAARVMKKAGVTEPMCNYWFLIGLTAAFLLSGLLVISFYDNLLLRGSLILLIAGAAFVTRKKWKLPHLER